MSTYCFIFARGGSKGLAHKNIRNFCNKPLIAHTIEFAKKLDLFKEIIVSTDSQEIADIAKNYGALVPFLRPLNLASDTAPERLAWRHAIEYVKKIDKDFDVFISLPCTAPLRTFETVKKCLDMQKANKDSLIITCTKAHNNPYFNMVKLDDNNVATLLNKSTVTRRQDAPVAYNMTTIAYVCDPKLVLDYDHIFDTKVIGVEAADYESIDIDNLLDFKIAEFLYKELSDGRLYK